MKHIVITGASSGLGAALAEIYAAPDIIVSLQGRNIDRLNAVAEKVERRGARTTIKAVDVTDAASMTAWLASCEQLQPIDILIANAGISAGSGSGFETEDQARAIFATNVTGVLNTLHPVILWMRERRQGQIAIMSSLAGFVALPGAPAYCASKAAVRHYGEALRRQLRPCGVKVSVICPGFVKTPMTDVNPFPMPFLMSPARAAAIIKRGLSADRGRIAFPWPMVIGTGLVALMPAALVDWATAQFPAKPMRVNAPLP